jgi:hypothetical protein
MLKSFSLDVGYKKDDNYSQPLYESGGGENMRGYLNHYLE